MKPVRVLHIIDTLGGGGSERLVWDIVRLSDPTRVEHRVVTIFPDGYLVPFVYAQPLRELGAYGSRAAIKEDFSRKDAKAQSKHSNQFPSFAPLRFCVRNLPPVLKQPLVRIWNFVFSTWQPVKRAAAHVPSMLSIPAEYFRFKPDVIHVHGFYSFKYGLLFKTFFRRGLVHIVPALFSQMEAQGTGWLASYYRRFHTRVDCFALDAGYRGELLGAGVPAEKLLDIDGTLDLAAIAPVKAERERHRLEVREKVGIPEDAIIALSVGRLDPSKGHAYALEALPAMVKQFPNLHWVVLGEGEHRRELEQRIKELGVERHAHLVGFDPEPLPYYAAADVYLRTTTMEGENISSRQAIAMGVPTVGFDTCCETDLIAKLGHGILVPNADAAALAAATCEILSLPDCGVAMGARGVDYCKAQMGIQKHVDDLLSLYTRLQGKTSTREVFARKGAKGNFVKKMNLPPELRCIEHQQPMFSTETELLCRSGCSVPIVNDIPRFVPAENYASAFGRQWKMFRKTQLDSHTGTTISRDRLQRCLGGSIDIIKGKSVLEVGCGAGRFTEVMLQAGARVFACDLSIAVEANYENCRHLGPDYFVCQADALKLPVAPHSFDFVVCLGVIQHTPSPEETIAALARYVRRGGTLAIDHYPPEYPLTRSRAITRQLLLKLPPRVAHVLALDLARLLVPIHRLTWNNRRGVWRVRRWLAKHSPLVDYYGIFPISRELLAEWAILDTHDTLTDYYKHLRSEAQIEQSLRACGFSRVQVWRGGNGVEARAS